MVFIVMVYVFCLSIAIGSLSVRPTVCLSVLFVCRCIYVCLSIRPSVCLYVHVSMYVHPSVGMSTCLYVRVSLSVCMSVTVRPSIRFLISQ